MTLAIFEGVLLGIGAALLALVVVAYTIGRQEGNPDAYVSMGFLLFAVIIIFLAVTL